MSMPYDRLLIPMFAELSGRVLGAFTVGAYLAMPFSIVSPAPSAMTLVSRRSSLGWQNATSPSRSACLSPTHCARGTLRPRQPFLCPVSPAALPSHDGATSAARIDLERQG